MIWMLVFLFFAAQLALCLLMIGAGQRRMEQGRVLWAMAIAAQSRLPIPDEIDAVAIGLSKRQRKRAYTLSDRLRSGEAFAIAQRTRPCSMRAGLVPKIMEPVFIFGVTIVVGTLFAAMYLPLFKLLDQLSGIDIW